MDAQMTEQKRPKQSKDKPVYFKVSKITEAGTNNIIGCLVPSSRADVELMRERHYRRNDVVRATLTLPRNAKFHRLVHQLGRLITQNVETFENMTSHDAIKRLQRESGVFCHVSQIDAAPVVSAILAAAQSVLGEVPTRMLAAVLPEIKTIELQEAQSMAFDSLDESDFRQFWSGICEHLIARYWPSLTIEQITEMAEMLPQRES